MSTIAATIRDREEDLDPVLRLLIRDDIVAWYTSKSMAKNDAKTQDLEKQLADRVSKNVADAQKRIAECAPVVTKKENERVAKHAVDARVRKLVDEASSPETLCMMPSNFQPWL